jgi:hypothetical protein
LPRGGGRQRCRRGATNSPTAAMASPQAGHRAPSPPQHRARAMSPTAADPRTGAAAARPVDGRRCRRPTAGAAACPRTPKTADGCLPAVRPHLAAAHLTGLAASPPCDASAAASLCLAAVRAASPRPSFAVPRCDPVVAVWLSSAEGTATADSHGGGGSLVLGG